MVPKFRAWDKQRDRLSVIDRLYFNTKGAQLRDDFSLYWRDMKDIILMQSTGLFDENGVEIFEGDVVRTTRILNRADETGGFYEYDKDFVGVVKQLEGTWLIDTGKDAVSLWTEIEENEVIGNIYEKPELVEDTP